MAASNNIVLELVSRFRDSASAGVKNFIAGVGRQVSGIGKSMAGLSAVMGQMPGAIGKAVGGAGRLFTAFSTMGPVGGILAGLNIAIETIGEKMKAAAEKTADAMREMYAAVHVRCSKIKDAILESVQDPLKKATTDAARASKAFETLAAAYLKVAAARNDTAAAADSVEMAKLLADRRAAVDAAKSPEEAAATGAAWDVRIAQARMEEASKRHMEAVDMAMEQADQDKRRLAAAANTLADAETALARAREEEKTAAEMAVNDDGEWHRRVKAVRIAAEEAVANAQNALAKAEGDAAASAERVTKANLDAERSAIENASAVAAAQNAVKKLEEARRKAAEAETARQREAEELADRRQREAEELADRRQREAEVKAARQKAMDALQERLGKAHRDLAAAEERAKDAANRAADNFNLFRNRGAREAEFAEEREAAKAERNLANMERSLQRDPNWRERRYTGRREAARRALLAREEAAKANNDAAALRRNVERAAKDIAELKELMKTATTL